jgi:hypothetical protein
MSERLMQWYVKRKSDQVIAKTPHYCENCHNTDLVIRQVSTLYLLGYVLAGIFTGIFITWWVGVMVTLTCLFINIKATKRQCKHCGSTQVHIPMSENSVSNYE